MAETVGGPTYRLVGTSDYMLGGCLLDLGEVARGEALLDKAVAIFDQNGMDYWSALGFERLTAAALTQGASDTASERALQAIAFLRKAKSPGHLVQSVDVTAGIALAHGRPNDALALCDDALREQDKAKAIDGDKVYGADALRCKAEALMELGRAADAIPYLERSLTLRRRGYRGDYGRAQFALARALTAAHRDPARAVALARSAREELAKYPFLAFDLHEVDAWLARRERGGGGGG
jgi:tetratricopeptide (TPR) repeat protein